MDVAFLVGVPRSGTTLTRMVLDAHTDIYSGPESPWLCGNFGPPSVRDLFEAMTSGKFSLIACMDQIDEDRVLQRLRELVWSLIQEEMAVKGKRIWVEKTPDNIAQVAFLHRLFPEAKFIHVLRDGRDVALSTLATSWRKLNYFVVAPRASSERRKSSTAGASRRVLQVDHRWARKGVRQLVQRVIPSAWSMPARNHAAFRDELLALRYEPIPNTYYHALWRWRDWVSQFEADAGHLRVPALTIRYEDLVADPRSAFAQILSFLGCEWQSAVLQYTRQPHQQGTRDDIGAESCLAHDSISTARVGTWPTKLTRWQRYVTCRDFDSFLVTHGYKATR